MDALFKNCKVWKLKITGAVCFTLVFAFVVHATDFSSTDYKVSAPVLYSGEYSTSTSFQLFGSISQIATGTSTVAGYQVRSGFLYFPVVTTPVASATAGAGQVSLTWSAATVAQGWSIGGYNVGQSTTIGGPYTYSVSLGNVTNSTRTGLTNGTTYYFIVRAQDAFGNSIATSSEVSAMPVASATAVVSTPLPGGGGILGAISGVIERIIERIIGEKECVPNTIGDINCDGMVDLADISILAYWAGKQNPPHHVDVSGDGRVGLRDFSVVAFYWTGSEPAEPKRVEENVFAEEPYITDGPYVLRDKNRASDRDEFGNISQITIGTSAITENERIAAVLPAITITDRSFYMWIIFFVIGVIFVVLWKYRLI